MGDWAEKTIRTATMVGGLVAIQDNKDVYSTVEFHRWVGRNELDPQERYLVGRYFQPSAKTLEAGTAGGRILFALRELGFADLHGFDYVPGFIEQARAADTEHSIHFEVLDATKLAYPDSSFDQVIYLQQLLSCMDGDNAPADACREAFRILRPGGIALFSFLSFEVRRNSVYRFLIAYLRMLRWALRSRRSIQALPWMRMGDRFNWKAFIDKGPYVHWFTVSEAAGLLDAAGFRIQGMATVPQIQQQRLCDTAPQLLKEPLDGAIYCVCAKPASPVGNERSGGGSSAP